VKFRPFVQHRKFSRECDGDHNSTADWSTFARTSDWNYILHSSLNFYFRVTLKTSLRYPKEWCGFIGSYRVSVTECWKQDPDVKTKTSIDNIKSTRAKPLVQDHSFSDYAW